MSVLDVFFYLALMENKDCDNYLKSGTFTRKKILVPISQDYHWSLVVSALTGLTMSGFVFHSHTDPL